jgi:F-type H+-transporting ATPase subunit a
MELSPDTTIYWEWGYVKINATLVFTWLTMVFLAVGSWLITRDLSTRPPIGAKQNILEAIVALIEGQVAEIMSRSATRYLPFIGTLFLFIVTMNLLDIIPGYRAPTASISTTAALALCVFLAVPLYGIQSRGLREYLRQYMEPSIIVLPFNIIGELSRTLALAVRLFGNIMSGQMTVAILLTLAPLFFPVIMQLLGLLIGFIQAYIFAVLAAVFIASGMEQSEDADVTG